MRGNPEIALLLAFRLQVQGGQWSFTPVSAIYTEVHLSFFNTLIQDSENPFTVISHGIFILHCYRYWMAPWEVSRRRHESVQPLWNDVRVALCCLFNKLTRLPLECESKGGVTKLLKHSS